MSGGDLIVFDEFTSVVDRTVAKIASAALAKAIRKRRTTARFVAVTCHYDVLDWLTPDWILDMQTGETQWRCLQRPPIELDIYPCRRAMWRMFAPHHYLTGSISATSQCFIAAYRQQAIAFAGLASIIAHPRWRRIGRLVVLPDYQGVGVGGALLDWTAQYGRARGWRISLLTSHPAMIHRCARSPLWRCTRHGYSNVRLYDFRTSVNRCISRFEFIGAHSQPLAN